MAVPPEIRKKSVYELEQLICAAAREILRREPRMREAYIALSVHTSLTAAHETLAAYHRAAALCAPELR